MTIEIIKGHDNQIADFFSSSSTPETDALRKSIDSGANTEAEMTSFARKLERERDEWAAMCGRYKQERDKVREELKKLEGAYEDATNYYARMIELREELDQVKEELKNKTYDKLKS